MIFVVCGKSRDGDKNTPCPLGLLDDLCICLSCLPRTNSGLSNLGSSLATGRAFGAKLCFPFPDPFHVSAGSVWAVLSSLFYRSR